MYIKIIKIQWLLGFSNYKRLGHFIVRRFAVENATRIFYRNQETELEFIGRLRLTLRLILNYVLISSP